MMYNNTTKKEAIRILKEIKEEFMGRFGGRNGKGKLL